MLAPFSLLYAVIILLRRWSYSIGIIRRRRLPVPVIVVGNVTTGGTGKTPVTLWLAGQLKGKGLSPGIVTRGYRGKVGAHPVQVTQDTGAEIVGDEAILLARRGGCPVIVHPDRVAAAQKLIEQGVNVVISDDGLQHSRLVRDIEIAVIDGVRRFGNGRLLPSGPLREPVSRLDTVDEILVQGTRDDDNEFLSGLSKPLRYFQLRPLSVTRLDDSETRRLEDFRAGAVHAIAGIGNPERFFAMLESYGIEVLRHPLADHANITQAELTFPDQAEIIMTEKDAVKCADLRTGNCWYVPTELTIDQADREALMHTIEGIAFRNAVVDGSLQP